MQAHEYAAAQNSIVKLYQNGLGVAQDNTKAFEWFLKSAKTDYVGLPT